MVESHDHLSAGKTSLMYYRADILEREGLAVPDTWDGFLQLAKDLNGTDFNGGEATWVPPAFQGGWSKRGVGAAWKLHKTVPLEGGVHVWECEL